MTPDTNTTFEGGETFILPKWLAQQVEGDSERIAELADLFREVRTRYLAKSLEEFASKLKTVQITRTGGLFNGSTPVQLPDDKKLQAALHQAIDQALALMV